MCDVSMKCSSAWMKLFNYDMCDYEEQNWFADR